MKYVFWDNCTDLTLISGRLVTPDEMRSEFPSETRGKTVLSVRDGVVAGVYSLDGLKEALQLTPSLSDEAALAEISRIRNAPPEPIPADQLPMSRADMQLLEQHLTEVELLILEAQNG